MTLSRRGFRRRVMLTLMAGMVTGCSHLPHVSLWPNKVPLDASVGLYDKASITYRLDAGHLNVPISVARVEGQRISYDELVAPPGPDQSVGTLTLTYPSPGAPGFAQAKVVISRVGQPKPSWWHNWTWSASSHDPADKDAADIQEVWSLEIPRNDFDRALEALRSQNYFRQEGSVARGATISAKLNGREVQKPWSQLPELDGLMQRVRREGRLIAYARPLDSPGTMPENSSLVAFRSAQFAKGNGPDFAVPGVQSATASGLSMPVPAGSGPGAQGTAIARSPATVK